jgi:hypothetical protein
VGGWVGRRHACPCLTYVDQTLTSMPTQQHHFEEIVASRERGRVAKEGAAAAAKAEGGAVNDSAHS